MDASAGPMRSRPAKNVTIADSDFHPLDPDARKRDAIANAPFGDKSQRPTYVTRPVAIGDDPRRVQIPLELTTDWTYVRFHGPHATQAAYQGRYGPDGLYWMAERLTSWLEDGCDVYAYFNNDDSGFAVEDARWLADRLGHRPE